MKNAPDLDHPRSESLNHGRPAANGSATLSDRVRSLRLADRGQAGGRQKSLLPWGLCGILLLVSLAMGYRAYLITPADEPSGQAPASPAAPVSPSPPAGASATPAEKGDVVLDNKGYIIAAHQIQLSPQVGGEIIWLDPDFKEGALYKKGARLAEVDPVVFRAQRDSARAALEVAKTNLREVLSGSAIQEIQAAKAQLDNMAAKLELSRIDERNKRRAGIATSRDDMEKAVAQIVVDQAALESQKQSLARLQVSLEERRLVAQAQVDQAEANLRQAQKQLDNCTMKAPTTGIVLTKKAELGGYVNPLAFGAAGYLCEMADLRDLEVELDIQERDINRVFTGQRCRVMPEAGQNDEAFLKTHPDGYAGFVSRRMPVANRSKGAVTVRVKVEIPEGEKSGEFLLPDMGALVSFLKKGK